MKDIRYSRIAYMSTSTGNTITPTNQASHMPSPVAVREKRPDDGPTSLSEEKTRLTEGMEDRTGAALIRRPLLGEGIELLLGEEPSFAVGLLTDRRIPVAEDECLVVAIRRLGVAPLEP